MNNNTADEFLYLVNLQNSKDLKVQDGITEESWDDLKEKLMTHDIREEKDGPAFMPVMMKLEKDWSTLTTLAGVKHFRGDVNVEAITALVIDLDVPGAEPVAREVFEGYEYIIHSTHQFTRENPWKYRMIIRLAEPILVSDWPMCFEALRSRIELDTMCCNPSRIYYYPSHSIESGISPRAFHKPGKAAVLNDILQLGDAQKIEESRNRLGRFKNLAGSKEILIKHFSGSTISRHELARGFDDYSESALMSRHLEALSEHSIDSSNHRLALSITGAEISRFGHLLNLRATLLFLFQQAAKAGRPLESGNTNRELPGMIITGFLKYAPGSIDSLIEKYGENLENSLAAEVRWAEMSYSEMEIRELFEELKTTEVKQEFYAVLRQRHMRALSKFTKDGDFKGLVKSVVDSEMRTDTPDYDEVAKALTRFFVGYVTTIQKKSKQSALQDLKNESPRIGKYISELGSPDSKKHLFLKSAFLVESSKATRQIREEDASLQM